MKIQSNYYSICKFLTGVVLLILIAGCKKEEITNTRLVTGTVKSKVNDLPVKGVPVLLEKCISEGFLWYGSTTCNELQIINTNPEGKYEFRYTPEGKYFFKISIPYNEFYTTSASVLLKNTNVNLENFAVSPLRILKIKYKNLRHDRNYIQISVGGGVPGNYLFIELYNRINPAYNLDTVFYKKIPAGDNYYLQTTLFTYPNTPTPPDYIFNTYNFYAPDQDTISINHIVL